ncbi:hypothetical protein MXD63_15970 [Frankia sp. Cpl3]|nr:hypothetical protein [Frankia sp. Cpl3]
MKTVFVAPQVFARPEPITGPPPVPAGPGRSEPARPSTGASGAGSPAAASSAVERTVPAVTPSAPVRCASVVHSRPDLTAVVVVGELAIGAVAVARQLARRQPAPHADVRMGPGGWVSLRGGSVRLRGCRSQTGHGSRHLRGGSRRSRRSR